MKLREQVLYFNRPAWIVSKRQPAMYEHGRFYGLSRQPNSSHVDYYDVPEKDLKPMPIVDNRNEVLKICGEMRKLELVK